MNDVKIIGWEYRNIILCSGFNFTRQMNQHVRNMLFKLSFVNDVSDATDDDEFIVYCDGTGNTCSEIQQKLIETVKQACDDYLEVHPPEQTLIDNEGDI